MICRMLCRIEQFLREHQDPRYRNAPWVLPRVWHGSGSGASDEELARLNLNVRDIGLDPAVISQQPINRMLRAMNRHAPQRAVQTEKSR